MKKKISTFVTGLLAGIVLATCVSSYAASELKNISVTENAVNLKINGNSVDIPNYVFDGRTYIQVRTLSEKLGKEVSWDPKSNTASIDDKIEESVSFPSSNISYHPSKQMSVEEIAAKSNTVVLIQVLNKYGYLTSMGSGFIVSNDGIVVTNYHVINGAQNIIVVTSDKKTYSTEVINYDSNKDIAILKLKDAVNLPTVTLGDSDKIRLGESVVAIGNPEGLQSVVSEGIISTTGRLIDGQNYIQITAPISPGSSGGALFNSFGEVIGITAAMLQNGQAINFAVPINFAKNLLNQYTNQAFTQVNIKVPKIS